MKRIATGIATAAIIEISISACAGQTSPPTPNQIDQNLQYFRLPGVIAPNHQPVECVLYDSGTNGTNQSKSWFSFTCDFDRKAWFPR